MIFRLRKTASSVCWSEIWKLQRRTILNFRTICRHSSVNIRKQDSGGWKPYARTALAVFWRMIWDLERRCRPSPFSYLKCRKHPKMQIVVLWSLHRHLSSITGRANVPALLRSCRRDSSPAHRNRGKRWSKMPVCRIFWLPRTICSAAISNCIRISRSSARSLMRRSSSKITQRREQKPWKRSMHRSAWH